MLGLEKVAVGKLPDHLAILVKTVVRGEEFALQIAIEGDKRNVFQVICFEPLIAAVLYLKENKSMLDEIFKNNKEYLLYFN
jgi:alpha-galactosidase